MTTKIGNGSDGFNSSEGISLKEYINDKLDSLEKSIDARFEGVNNTTNSALAAADKATLKAEAAQKAVDDAEAALKV